MADYEGIELLLTDADAKQYTFVLKDQLLSPNLATGRDQSTISYKYDFQVAMERGEDKTVSAYISWKDLKATYRGKEENDALPLNTGSKKRMSFTMRR